MMALTGNHALNLVPVFFGRLGIWFLTGPSLAEFCINRRVVIENTIYLGVYGVTKETVIARFPSFNLSLVSELDDVVIGACFGVEYRISIYTDSRKGTITCGNHCFPREWLKCGVEVSQELRQKNSCMSDGMWRIPLNEMDSIEFRIPYMVGSVLDAWDPEWWKKVIPDRSVWRFNDVFFDNARRLNGIELIGQMHECGKKAGIDHAMFIGYGTALGMIRHGDFIPSDRDMDMCIVADWITVEAALEYVRLCKEAGLGEHRWVPAQCRSDTGMPLWFSLGPKNPVSESGVKSCNWFWFSHGGYWWHSKGGMWVSPTKFSKKKTQYNAGDAAIAKGVPLSCLSKLVTGDFLGRPVRIPDSIGACLDHFYPCWPVPREGASAHQWIMVVEKWEDKNTWRIG